MDHTPVHNERQRGCNGKPPRELVGSDAAMVQLRTRMKSLSSHDCPIVIYGESGTGKELVARHVHAASPRAAGPFVAVDCTTSPGTLLESQLFGHVGGDTPGSTESSPGLYRAAEGGTLFLDEVGQLGLDQQAGLHRCLQQGAVVPVGGLQQVPVDVRIIAATHQSLEEMVSRGDFCEGLYYRLHVVRLDVPPLRDRPGDIARLARHFLDQQADSHQEPARSLSSEAVGVLEAYDWPGNVRELRNVTEHAAVFAAHDHITPADLPETLRRKSIPPETQGGGSNGNGQDKIVPLAVAERSLVERALRATSGNQTRAADMLGVERHRLARMIRRHGLRALARSRGG